MMHLQSQVNPYFFFNILNSLYGWVDKDPKQAQALILKLSDLMRYSIYDGQKELVLLEEEIAYLKNDMALHKMRYLKDIDLTFEVDVPQSGLRIRPLLRQSNFEGITSSADWQKYRLNVSELLKRRNEKDQ